MRPAGAPTLFVIDDDAVGVRASMQGVRNASMDSIAERTQLPDRFCNRLLIEGVRVRRDPAKRDR
jgi:hypothetical protein